MDRIDNVAGEVERARAAIQSDSNKRLAILKDMVAKIEAGGLVLTDLNLEFAVESDSSVSRHDVGFDDEDGWLTERQWRRGFTLSYGR